jgi:hypothetical protein
MSIYKNKDHANVISRYKDALLKLYGDSLLTRTVGLTYMNGWYYLKNDTTNSVPATAYRRKDIEQMIERLDKRFCDEMAKDN